jgi:hypothetical protein
MSNPAHGYADITEHLAVRINDDGEFIHQNQDTVDAQRVHTVSHGCINLSAQDGGCPYRDRFLRRPCRGEPGTSVQLSQPTATSTTGPSPAISHRVRG